MLKVNENCIGCGICAGYDLFKIEGVVSIVTKQPQSDQEKIDAKEAVKNCPAEAIEYTQ